MKAKPPFDVLSKVGLEEAQNAGALKLAMTLEGVRPDTHLVRSEDYTFGDIDDGELAYCMIYEYARSSKDLKHAICHASTIVNILRTIKKTQWEAGPKELGQFLASLLCIYQNVPRRRVKEGGHKDYKPSVYYFLTNPLVVFLVACGFDKSLRNDLPWVKIPNRVKQLRKYFKGDYETAYKLTHEGVVDADALWLLEKHDDQCVLLKQREIRFNQMCVSFHVLSVDWERTDDALMVSFRQWLEQHRPKARKSIKRTGKLKPRDHLYQLAAHRLLQHYRWNEAAHVAQDARGRCKNKSPLYSEQTSWKQASRDAMRYMRQLEEGKVSEFRYLLRYNKAYSSAIRLSSVRDLCSSLVDSANKGNTEDAIGTDNFGDLYSMLMAKDGKWLLALLPKNASGLHGRRFGLPYLHCDISIPPEFSSSPLFS